MPCWLVGTRNKPNAVGFVADLAPRLANKAQLTIDGWNGYPDALWAAFGPHGVHHAMLNNRCADQSAVKEAKRRYSPAPMSNAEKIKCQGNLDMEKVSTSHAERENLSVRMRMRRFTRLTTAFSKKLESHMHASSFHFMVYNFAEHHQDDPRHGGRRVGFSVVHRGQCPHS